MTRAAAIHALARCLLAGDPGVEPIVARAFAMFGKRWRWLRPLARRYAAAISGVRRPTHRDVVQYIEEDRGFLRAWSLYGRVLTLSVAAAKAPESASDLARWLGLEMGELRWFADLAGIGYQSNNPKLGHYHYRIVWKRFGSVRLIEAPKPRLKELQRRILKEIVEETTPHSAAHGFVKGRSIRTFAAPHAGQRVVLRMDLQDFFPSISRARVRSMFRVLGYSDEVAALLAGVCSNAVPRGVWRDEPGEVNRDLWREARELYREPHLPQGAPTSPALANLCMRRADARLSGLAKSAGAAYTRYADDLAFSGGDEFDRRAERFAIHAAAILSEEGFRVHHRKTRIMRQGVRQYLAGIVVNQKLNVVRADFDRLKATLTNCVRHGPASQSCERARIEGQVAFVESIHPARGKRLREIFARIRWVG